MHVRETLKRFHCKQQNFSVPRAALFCVFFFQQEIYFENQPRHFFRVFSVYERFYREFERKSDFVFFWNGGVIPLLFSFLNTPGGDEKELKQNKLHVLRSI